VIDLFAGSGALGLEALSRGAAHCLFVDQDRSACAAIAENLAALGCETRADVLRLDAARLGFRSAGPPRAVAFLDPPYSRGLIGPALAALAGGGWLAPAAVAIAEHGAAEGQIDAPAFDQIDRRTWGAAHVEFLKLRA
jgi:16S rRNA (guanine966-N2)-methyltransferase